jgi:hypothetical protein
MALFSGKNKDTEKQGAAPPIRQVVGREVFCTICNAGRMFSRCWLRVAAVSKCSCCGLDFPDPEALYRKNLPVCTHCGEYLEHPGFEYGLCDGCGTKFELVQGAKPGILPNKQQRDKMSTYGKTWSKD